MSAPRSLPVLAEHIDAQAGWWRFPEEPGIAGFLGDGDVFFVGDQPSTSAWPNPTLGPDMILPRALERLARRRTGWPLGTIAWYGQDNRRASKVVAAVVDGPDHEPHDLAKWMSDDADLRTDRGVTEAVLAHFQAHGVERVVVRDAIIGCPHEHEGLLCPDPACTFWVGRDRFADLR